MTWRFVQHRMPNLRSLPTSPALIRGKGAAYEATRRIAALLHLLVTVFKGLRRQSAWLRSWWARSPKERRRPVLAVAAVLLLCISLVPYGPAIALLILLGLAAWAGHTFERANPDPGGAAGARLQCLYEALIPWLSSPKDPDPLFAHGGAWTSAFSDFEFDDEGRLTRLRLRYPAYFTDQETASRSRVENVLCAKAGRGREYRFTWCEEDNELLMSAPPPLPTDIATQPFVTGQGEIVLGFTDAESTERTTPVTTADGETRQAPPVVWRTGPRSTEAHLLALGLPGSGTTNLLRSLAFQALRHGDIVLIDGTGSGEYAFLAGRPGVLAVESGISGTVTVLEWAAHETERRLIAVNRARQSGTSVPADSRRPLWIILDRPASLTQLAAAENKLDPQLLVDLLVVGVRGVRDLQPHRRMVAEAGIAASRRHLGRRRGGRRDTEALLDLLGGQRAQGDPGPAVRGERRRQVRCGVEHIGGRHDDVCRPAMT